MKIENCVRIIDGVLQTTPSVDAFERIIFDAHRILRGDCFFDKDSSAKAIDEAIEKGAYAIITTRDFEHDDTEIAWIRVASIEQALIKLLRYIVAQKSLVCVVASPIQAGFLQMVQANKTIKMIQGSLYTYALEILKAKEQEMFCFERVDIASFIAPQAKYITPFEQALPIVSKGLFISSFSYNEKLWHEQKIPALFVPEFLSVLAFCDENKIAWQCDNLAFCDHFYPQFVTPSLRKKEFGTSDQVLIFETDTTLFKKELSYLSASINPQGIVVCLPLEKASTFSIEENITMITYKDIFELACLRQKTFQYALVLGDKEAFEPLLNQSFTTQPTLF